MRKAKVEEVIAKTTVEEMAGALVVRDPEGVGHAMNTGSGQMQDRYPWTLPYHKQWVQIQHSGSSTCRPSGVSISAMAPLAASRGPLYCQSHCTCPA